MLLTTRQGRRRRRSNVSAPHSPRTPPTSPRPRPSRTNTTSASSIHPHQTISRIFLSLPDEMTSPHPLRARPRNPRRPSGQSDFHLGLGRFTSYDESAKPGPSPPISPAASPTKRNFTYSAQTRRVKPRHPPSPLTPSRAPRKAAELLGAAPPPRSSKRKEHFRPLPARLSSRSSDSSVTSRRNRQRRLPG